jgi:hypothetical protein
MSEKSSNIPHLNSPEFKPSIPQHMLDNISDPTDRYMIEQMSVMTQQAAWQTHKLMNIYDYTRSINGKVIELEQFRNDLLTQMKVEQKLDDSQQKHMKYYRVTGLVFLALVYPVYLAAASQTGLFDVVKRLLFVVQ